MIPILLSILLFLLIIVIVCINILDKWRFRADQQYPYVRELMDEWERVTLRLLSAAGADVPEVSVSGSRHPWQAASAANRLAAACPVPDPASPAAKRQRELEEELIVFQDVYNDLARSFNKSLDRPVVRQLGRLFRWTQWEALEFHPDQSA